MFNSRIRTIARTATASAVMASGLGLAAFGLAGTANAAPINHAPELVYCQVYHNGIPVAPSAPRLPLSPHRNRDPAHDGLGPFCVCGKNWF